MAGLLVGSLAFGGQLAAADNLDDQAGQLNNQIQAVEGDILGDQAVLQAAAAALLNSQNELSAAQTALIQARAAVDEAQRIDEQLAAELAQAEADLVAANEALAKGKAELSEQIRVTGQNVRQTAQQNTALMGLGMLMTNISSGNINDRLQWSQNLLTATQNQLELRQAAERRLAEMQAAQQAATELAAQRRQEAAEHLQVTQQTQAAAQAAEQAVAEQVRANQAAQAQAEQALAEARATSAALHQQAADVARQIQERNAAAAAEALRQAQLAQQAADAQKAAQAAAVAAQAQQAASGTAPISYSVSASGLINPLPGAPVTSVYARRLNPVLGVWEFHDGTDIGAPCGTPMLAAASGTVAQVQSPAQSGGYGWRMVIDHGLLNGQFVSTGYNHAASFTVAAGQHVNQGQVIGYEGTTGLSTGCHLHFHVYVNGQTVDPQSMVRLG